MPESFFNLFLEGITAISALIGVIIIILDRTRQVSILIRQTEYGLPIERDSFGGLVRSKSITIYSTLSNIGRNPIFICDVYLLINKRIKVLVHPFEFFDRNDQVPIDPGRSENAIFHGDDILRKLPAEVGEKFSVQVVFVSEIGKKYISRRLVTRRSTLKVPEPNR